MAATIPPEPGQPKPPPDKAAHGYRNEVTWDSGQGHQPYANQGQKEAPEAGGPEYAEGDRGTHSGENQDQLEDVKRK